ncbi:MAG: hypothetical protein M1837_005098 [Sclerophora amabilis]|nr:MAG: hypothetical protein M1837_005098 [Sclerophora amabilis]
MSDAGSSFRVLIIGAGSAGLLVAQGLKKHGIRCTVFEQDASLEARLRDWNFGIYWAQVPLDECLTDELSRLVQGAQVDSRISTADDVMPIFNGASGEVMKIVPAPHNIRLQRRKFLRLISTDVDVQYGKRLANIESDGKTAKAIFEDGSSETGNLLIGAEGAHSKVRTFLLGPEKAALEMSPLVASVSMARLPEETAVQFQKLHPRFCIAFHPNGYFSWIGVHDANEGSKPGDWTFMIIQSWNSDQDPSKLSGPLILEDMKRRGKEFSEPFNTIYQSIPDGTPCWHNRLSSWSTEPWDNRNSTVTLAGDAAHPMTFHRGQGLNNAIHDAANLTRQLKEVRDTASTDAVASAITAYEQELWQRGKEAVLASNANSKSVHNWSELLQSPLFTAGLKQKIVREEQNN